jgi:branched-chain amino acid transport system ATP-binding protein
LANDALTLAGVNTLYGDSHVLHDVSFRLREGRVLALLGRNGAGKTTCINTIIGFLPARAGEISLFGKPIARLSPEIIVRNGIGLVPQGRRIFPSLTVHENLRVAACKPAADRTSWSWRDIYAMFPPLNARRNQAAGSLSGGEQQMLAIGRALMTNPRVVLMDEPSEGLAPQIVAEVGRILVMLKQRGLSIILVEQNTALAFKVADDAVILNTGRLVFDGPVEQIKNRPHFLLNHLGVY